MKAWIVSDIHHTKLRDLRGDRLSVPKADVCICVGDVADSIDETIAFLLRVIEPQMQVILVLGNHDYYDSGIDLALITARRLIGGRLVHLLENQSLILEDCRFIGATLWTDFSVSVGDDDHVPPEERRAKAFNLLPSEMMDFFSIFSSIDGRFNENGMVTVKELLDRHRASRAFIDQELARPFDGRTIVLTHHAPLMQSFDPNFFGNITNAAFGSDLGDLIQRRRPSVWIHGHIHKFRDYMFDKTWIICNPVGYHRQRAYSGFRSNFVLDL
ncbi:phosphohydrolase [Rhizobium leguminosarum bv. trifolii]|uniref:metallophosphoesterase n=1 Tax=Rhizobium leguminosarum TaxID=384 RepID=UPI00140F58C4|nr:metallophosphoesterase [Rhizobium leguminosarum]QIO70614.1 phosphohydrolase [Rhizobium leguminosarum bv. trifolii]QIO77619.1 phosphohydrolase [Rhizobium leguminosarum bv. trifolii]